MKKITALSITFAFLFSLFAPLTSAQQNRPVAPTQPPPRPMPDIQERRSRPPQTRPTPRPAPSQAGDVPAPQETEGDEDDVVCITTNLVQMDVVVVDKKGNQVTDLRAEDFEVFEDKRPQQITNFSYILNENAPRPSAPDADSSPKPTVDKLAPPAPPRRLRPEQVRRTMALVVDDLGLSFGSTDAVRGALRKFVDEQMQPNDLVAIIRTSAGMGALQQFTSDKRQLHAAIERVRWYPGGRSGVSAFAPLTGVLPTPDGPPRGATPIDERDVGEAEAGSADDPGGRLESFREDLFAVGTLGAVNFVVRGMRELPGRKSVTLFSDGFSLRTSERGPSSERVYQALRQLTDLANRASVVIYSIDARGLVVPMLSAEDNTSGMSAAQIEQAQSRRSFAIFDTQGGLDFLARSTGGFLIKNSNDLTRGVRRIVEDQRGYYLIGYRPEGETFDRRFHNFSVKVKRPGLSVRTRRGFYGIRDAEARPVLRTREEQLLGALVSPFSAAGVRLRLTAIFGNSEQSGSFMTSLMHINGSDLKFTKQPDGIYRTVIDVAGVAYSDNGRVVDSRDQAVTLKMSEAAYQKAQRDGLVYSFVVPIKKAGAYQLRMAVRDTATARTGSASQFIEVPDLKKDRLVLSGLVLSGLKGDDNNSATTDTAATSTPSGGRSNDDGAASLTSPAVRRFRIDSTLPFAYAIYNARLDKTTRRPQLTVQTRIFSDGKLVFNGTPTPINLASLPDPKRIELGGKIDLRESLPPGEYILQIVVTDALAKEKHRTATQWSDFEIVK